MLRLTREPGGDIKTISVERGIFLLVGEGNKDVRCKSFHERGNKRSVGVVEILEFVGVYLIQGALSPNNAKMEAKWHPREVRVTVSH